MPDTSNGEAGRPWTFLTNHAHVLLCLAADPDARMRDVAFRVGITERAVQRIVAELAAAGCLRVTRVGRRNTYEVEVGTPLRPELVGHRTVGDLVELGAGVRARRR